MRSVTMKCQNGDFLSVKTEGYLIFFYRFNLLAVCLFVSKFNPEKNKRNNLIWITKDPYFAALLPFLFLYILEKNTNYKSYIPYQISLLKIAVGLLKVFFKLKSIMCLKGGDFLFIIMITLFFYIYIFILISIDISI